MNELTMTSLEIAELTGKCHDNVIMDIEKILDEPEIDPLKFQVGYSDSNNQEGKMYSLPEREYLLIVSVYSPECMRAAIDRWEELKAKKVKQDVPTNPVALAAYTAAMALQEADGIEARRDETDLSVLAVDKKVDTVSERLDKIEQRLDEIEQIVGVSTHVSSQEILDMRYLLEEDDFGFGKSVKQVNKKLVKLGFLEQKYRMSPTGKKKGFKALTEKGLIYGINVTITKRLCKTKPYYYGSKFEELLALI